MRAKSGIVAVVIAGLLVAGYLWRRARGGDAADDAADASGSAAANRSVADGARARGAVIGASAAPALPKPPVDERGVTHTRGHSANAAHAPVTLVAMQGVWMLNLAGGPPTSHPFGDRDDKPTRRVLGRVVDGANRPVAGASVLANNRLDIFRENLLVKGGATTDASGAFTIDDAPIGPCVVIAYANGDWSERVALPNGADSGPPLVLHVDGHGTVTAELTYDGKPEEFEVAFRSTDRAFNGIYETGGNGRLVVDSLPADTYEVSAGVAQGFGGGAPHYEHREITLAAGDTVDLAIDFKSGPVIAMTASLPAGVTAHGLVYFLFDGVAPRTAAEARTRAKADSTPSMMFGGDMAMDTVQFHDVAPGAYSACAGIYDIALMGVGDAGFGCAGVNVKLGDNVDEIEIALTAGSGGSGSGKP